MTCAMPSRGRPPWSRPQEKQCTWRKAPRWCSLALLLFRIQCSALAQGESDTSRSSWRSETRRFGPGTQIATILSKSGCGRGLVCYQSRCYTGLDEYQVFNSNFSSFFRGWKQRGSGRSHGRYKAGNWMAVVSMLSPHCCVLCRL